MVNMGQGGEGYNPPKLSLQTPHSIGLEITFLHPSIMAFMQRKHLVDDQVHWDTLLTQEYDPPLWRE